jgi:hypothetical protein
MIILVAAVLGAGEPSSTLLAVQETPARPLVELEKTRYVVGERVFFWVGVMVPDGQPVPAALYGTGRVVLTRPDGTERSVPLGWPVDGRGVNVPGDLGWRGGQDLGTEPQQPGRWTVVVEFAGRRSPPATFMLEHATVLEDIDASFTFTSPLVLDAIDAAATLVVHNRSAETIRFPEPGLPGTHVTIGLTSTSQPPAHSFSGFVPRELLIKASGVPLTRILVDRFTWDLADRVPGRSVAPGGIYRLRLPVADVMQAIRADRPESLPAGEYELRLSTELHLLIGDREGPWRDVVPIRLPVVSTALGLLR